MGTYKPKLNMALLLLNLTLPYVPLVRPQEATYIILFNKIFCAPCIFELKFATFMDL